MKITSILVALLVSVSFGFAAEGNKPKPDPAAQFAKMDKDGDAKLSKDEFLATAKDDAAKAKKAEVFAKKDKDADGFLSKEEFLAKPEKKK